MEKKFFLCIDSKKMVMKKAIVLSVIDIENKNLKIAYILNKALSLCIICDTCGSKVEKIFKEEK